MEGVIGIEKQPVSEIEWVEANTLRANDYNPNQVFIPELKLLKLSILEDGWTQPIVARVDGEIVDGFHRWKLATEDKQIRAMTGGKVPVAWIREIDPAHQRMSTIRHNRARGSHHVLKMAAIIQDLSTKRDCPMRISLSGSAWKKRKWTGFMIAAA